MGSSPIASTNKSPRLGICSRKHARHCRPDINHFVNGVSEMEDVQLTLSAYTRAWVFCFSRS